MTDMPDSPLSASPAEDAGPRVEGTWPKHCPQRQFVEGAKWWHYRSTGFTAWPAERNEMEAEAVRRFGEPHTETP